MLFLSLPEISQFLVVLGLEGSETGPFLFDLGLLTEDPIFFFTSSFLVLLPLGPAFVIFLAPPCVDSGFDTLQALFFLKPDSLEASLLLGADALKAQSLFVMELLQAESLDFSDLRLSLCLLVVEALLGAVFFAA